MSKPRWTCTTCAKSNSYWTAKCPECGITVVQNKKILMEKTESGSKVPCGVGLCAKMTIDEILEVFKSEGMNIELGAQYSVKGQIAQLINGLKRLGITGA